jgi:hypothetical protein
MIEEVMVGVQVETTISDIHFLKADPSRGIMNDTFDIEYDLRSEENPYMTDGVLDHYQCVNCGFVLRDAEENAITDEEGLFDWLIEHKEKREKDLNAP